MATRPLLLLVLATLFVSVPSAGAGSLDKVWTARLRAANRALLDGKHAIARRTARDLAAEIVERLGPGQEGGQALGLVSVYRALAEGGLGKEDDAIWYWQVALNLDPSLKDLSLGHFGPPGELLSRTSLRTDQGCNPAAVDQLCGDDAGPEMTPPEVRKKAITYPTGARYFKVDGTLVVQVIITARGTIEQPLVLQALPAASLTYAALEAVRSWRVEPAKRDDEPVDVFYTLSVNYKLEK